MIDSIIDSIPNYLPPILLFLLFIFLIILSIIYEQKQKETYRKRSADIRNFCNKNNCKYSSSMKVIPEKVCEFPRFTYNVSNLDYLNIIYGNREGIDFYIIDRRYVTGKGKSRHINLENYCIIHDTRMNFPQFFMRDEYSFFDDIGKLLGGQDINFSNDSIFSKKFVLQGKKEGAVREFFRNSVRRAFVENHISGFCYEASSDCFMVRSAQYSTDIQEMMKLLSYTKNIYNKLVSELEPN